MPNDAAAAPHYEFGPFRLDAASRALYRGEEFLPLTPKAAELLLLLVQEAGRVVTKEQILERVWPGVVVEEGVIANHISALRKAIDTGEFGADGPIATVPRRGYRFTAQARATGTAAAPTEAPSPRPPITERDTILIADIENRTGDPVFDGTIRQALLLHLAQSPYLEIVTDNKVLSALGYMGKPGAAITGDVALEVCQRTGSRAVITGSIFAFDDEYLIGLQALDADGGGILVTEQARARGKGEVLRALDAAAIGLRKKLGESLASVKRFSRPFDEVATASLEALKAYAMGRMQWVIVGEAAAEPYFRRAIELDPDFASPYAALAHVCGNMGEVQEGMRHMQAAYDRRERATERERVRIVAGYHTVTGDLHKAIDAHIAWATSYPREGRAFVNLANSLMPMGQWEKAAAAAQHGNALEPTNAGFNNLVLSLMALGRDEEARAILEDAFTRGFDHFYLHLDGYLQAFIRGDTTAMNRHVGAVLGRPAEEDYLLAAQADTEAYFGRFTRARELSRRASESARNADAVEMSAMWMAQAALREAKIGEGERARAGALAALDAFRSKDVDCLAAFVLARSGDSDDALRLAGELDRAYPQSTTVQRHWLPCIRAGIALAAKDWQSAIDALEAARAMELALNVPFEVGFMLVPWLRGVALLGAARGDEAAGEFAKIIERPGLIKNFVLFPLAHLRASKALEVAGRREEAAALRARFDEMWKGADAAVA